MSKNVIIKNNKKPKTSLNPLQQTFNGRKKKIETLQKKCQECITTLDRHLDFYTKEILPKEEELIETTKQVIKILDPYILDKKSFNKEKRNTLKEIILGMFEKVINMQGPDVELDEELSIIYKKHTGSSIQADQSMEFEEFKSQMENQFKGRGINLDLSDVKMEGFQEEILAKIFASMENQNAFFNKEEKEIPRAKSKKQIEKEEKALAKADLQKKEIGAIYKQLAKVFHPDLEQDPVIKLEKEALMKRLTVAYEAGDLHTILALEIETLDISDSLKKTRSDEQLKIYNQLLQSQIEMLQSELNGIPSHYKYSNLNSYPYYDWEDGDECLGEIKEGMQDQLKTYKKLIKEKDRVHVIAIIRSIIQEQELMSAMSDLDFLFDDF